MNDGMIQRQSDLALIPLTVMNPDYVQYLKDKEAGAEVLPFDYEAEAKRQEEENKKNYGVFRAREYPPIADYLDGIVKGDQKQIDKYIADCLAVKAKYPKP
jgi:hypothetical protein